METEAKTNKKEIKDGAKYAVLFVLMALGAAGLINMIVPALPSKICNIIGITAGALVALCGSCKPEKGTLLADKKKLSGTGFLVTLGAFMLAKLLSLGLSIVVALLLSKDGDFSALVEISTATDHLFLEFLFMGIFTPICEEITFRGCIGNSYIKHGIWFAMIMSTLFFAIYHCNILQLFSTFLPGIVLFYVAINYSLKWSILFHFINNGVLAIGTQVLQKVSPESAAANYGEYVIEGILVILALLLWKKDNATEKIKAFLSGPKDEKGAYGAAIGNIWFVLLFLAFAAVTALMLLMLWGKLPELPAVG